MYVHNLELEQVRTFTGASLAFQVPGRELPLPNLTLIVGTNGAGKSTLLRSVALAALAPVLRSSGYAPRSIARRVGGAPVGPGFLRGKFSFQPEDGVPATEWNSELRINPARTNWSDRLEQESPPWADAMFETDGPAFFVVGYGANRRVDSSLAFQMQEKERHPRFLRVASLFEESVVLRPLSSWLPRWQNPGRRKQVITLINEIIGSVKVVEQNDEGEYLFERNGSLIPFDALSDGYRAFIGWVGDLLYHVTRGVPSGAKLDQTSGIALIDEIDLHMHPQWQREVLPRLAAALPRIQFVCTTHSPLVIGSVHRHNVLVLKEEGGATRIEPSPIEVHGLSSDQILTSEYFGLDSTRAPAFAENLERVASRAREGDTDQAKQYLRMLTLGERALVEPKPPTRRKTVKRKAAPKRRRS